ncbi:hypothetical protein Goe26_01970 [Bacillus phage vB_BsuM-Goe26]|nr:hypothetical protein Goe26_01970 [Bacillus phage vB_BsuM-Goe26]
MRVKDLIKELSTFDPEAEIRVQAGEEVLGDIKVTEGYDDNVYIGE